MSKRLMLRCKNKTTSLHDVWITQTIGVNHTKCGQTHLINTCFIFQKQTSDGSKPRLTQYLVSNAVMNELPELTDKLLEGSYEQHFYYPVANMLL